MLTDAQLTELERLEAAASPPPWTYTGPFPGQCVEEIDKLDMANDEFIAALRNAARDLIAAARENARLHRQIDTLNRNLDEVSVAFLVSYSEVLEMKEIASHAKHLGGENNELAG